MNFNTFFGAKPLLQALCHAVLALSLLGFGPLAQAGKTSKPPPTTTTPAKFSYYVTGDVSGAVGGVAPPKKTTSIAKSYVLMGGGPDVDDAFRWMIKQAGITTSTGGRLVVIRTTGNGDYNPYIYYSNKRQSVQEKDIVDGWVGGASLGLTSVETLVLPDRAAANDDTVNKIVANANALWIAGGDQSTYINNWKGSKLEGTLNTLMSKNVPIGGTSAGLAVMGGFDYSAQFASATSDLSLANPYYVDITIDPAKLDSNYQALEGDPANAFISPEPFRNVIFDSHLDSRDRLGRLIAFTSRLVGKSSYQSSQYGCEGGVVPLGLDGIGKARGVGIGVETALLVEQTGTTHKAMVVTNVSTISESSVYFVQVTGPEVCKPGVALKTPGSQAVKVLKVKAVNDATTTSSAVTTIDSWEALFNNALPDGDGINKSVHFYDASSGALLQTVSY